MSTSFAADFSPDGETALYSLMEDRAYLWRWREDRIVELMHDTDATLTHAAFCADGQVVTSTPGETRIWTKEGHATPQTLTIDGTVLAHSRDCRHVAATGGRDKKTVLQIWSTSGTLEAEWRHEEKPQTASFSPDGAFLVTDDEGEDRTARMWNWANLRNDGLPDRTFRHSDYVLGARFSADGHSVLTWDRTDVKVWTLDGELRYELDGGHQRGGYIRDAVTSPDGRRLVSSAWREVIVWSLDPDLQLERLRHLGIVVDP